jgi:hypothetical protein
MRGAKPELIEQVHLNGDDTISMGYISPRSIFRWIVPWEPE